MEIHTIDPDISFIREFLESKKQHSISISTFHCNITGLWGKVIEVGKDFVKIKPASGADDKVIEFCDIKTIRAYHEDMKG